MPIRRRWKPGDHLCVCDRTGRTVYASQTVREWNGLRVWKRAELKRNPQDFVRGLSDKQTVEDARPRGIDTFTGPLTTELDGDHAAGSQTIAVLSSERFEPGDHLRIGLNNREMFRTIVQTIPDVASIELTQKLPWAASSGNTVINITAVAQSDLA
jgi:hypothetical protein